MGKICTNLVWESKEQRIGVKMKALEAGKTMNQYILDCIYFPFSEEKFDNIVDRELDALNNGFVANSKKIKDEYEVKAGLRKSKKKFKSMFKDDKLNK